jgi:uncharacterized protein (TIGR00730 family)
MPDVLTKRARKVCIDEGEFQGNAVWDLQDILREFIKGFNFLVPLKKEVTIFGSARFSSDSHWYQEASKLGNLLAENGYTVITGGGPGIMEGANFGAHKSSLKTHRECSVGLDIILPSGERRNPYVERRMPFHYFFTRKVMLSASAQAYIFFPGGFGTIDEFTEILTLIQTKKMEKVAMVCMGKEYWGSFLRWMTEQMLENGEKMIGKRDLELFKIVDTAEEAMKIVKRSREREFF